MPEPPEGSDDLIGYVQPVVAPAQFGRATMITGWRYDDAAGAEHGLRNEGGDIARADRSNRLFQLAHEMIAELLHGHAGRPAIRIGRGDVMHEVREIVEVG